MKKARGNKTSKVVREKRKQAIVASLEAGKKLPEIKQELGLANGTFYRYVAELSLDYANLTSEHNAKLRERMAGELAARADDVLQGKLDPKSATAWVRIVGEFNDLLGLKSPSKSVRVNVNTNPEDNDLFLRFRRAVSGMHPSAIERAFRYIEAGCPNFTSPVVSQLPSGPKTIGAEWIEKHEAKNN